MFKKAKKTQAQQTPALQSAYKSYIVQSNIKRLRVGCLLGGTLVPLGSLFDYFIYPELFKSFLLVRLFFGLLYGLIYLVSFTEFTRKHSVGMMLFLTESIAIPIVMMICFTGGYLSPYYAGLNLIILGVGVLFTWMISEAVIVCLLIYLTYLIPVLLLDTITDYHTFFNNNYFISFTIIIAVVSNYFASKLRESDFVSRHKLGAAVKQLNELDKAKTSFFSGISHELRTPLTLILAPIENLLKQSKLNKETRGRLEICHSNALRLLKLINNLLDVVRINTGRMELRYSNKDVTKLLKQVVVNVSSMAEKKNIKIEFVSKGNGFTFFWDEDQLEKVIVNLIYNSLKFTPEQGTIKVGCKDKGDEVVISIKDSGIGIPEDQVGRVFDTFYQVDSGSKRSYEGSGMGLSLCRQIVELHGGKIWAESKLGEGTKMIFTLPKKLEVNASKIKTEIKDEDWTKQVSKEAIYEKGEVGILDSEDKKRAAEPDQTNHDGSGTVLVVEDNHDMREFVCLEMANTYTVLSAMNGQEGLEIAEKESPDLIISDVMMPVMDGYELCRHLKAGEKTKQIPVLMLTAKTELDMRLSGYEQGADDYVAKPFNLEELMAKAKALIQGRRLEREMEVYRRLASVGELAAGVAHEINNALNVAVLANSRLKKLVTNQAGGEQLQVETFLKESGKGIDLLNEGIGRAHGVVKSLLTFSQKNSEGFKKQNIQEGLNSTLTMLESDLKIKAKVVKVYSKENEAYCDLNQLNQVFLNILKNSIEAITENGIITLKTWVDEENYFVSIKDNGHGIAKEEVGRIFDPFFTTKPVGQGTGLGLSVSYNIMQEHGGSLICKSEPDQGAEFILSLPISLTK